MHESREGCIDNEGLHTRDTDEMPPKLPLPRLTNPAIIPISPRTFGNNVPKSLHKTRRSWWPNVTRANLSVNILDGLPLKGSIKGKEKEVLGNAAGAITQAQVLKGVKIAVRDLKDVDKAGGVEGLLVRPRPTEGTKREVRADDQ